MELRIENMTCGGCARAVTKAIQSVDADANVTADPVSRTIKVETNANTAEVRQALEQAGYPAVN